MKIQWKKLIIAIAIPLVVGGIAALITMSGMDDFATLNKPLFSPPVWLFPIAWTVLYTLMGVASYSVAISDKMYRAQTALAVYLIQLAFNFVWPIVFFNLNAYWFSFVWLLLLWVLIVVTLALFYKISKVAGYLMIPYLVWVTFAAYLNLGIAILN